jgi:ribosomal-protein-alanine N-acetyltransferase
MLETERLLHRKFKPDDLDKLIELRSDTEVNQYLGGARLQNPEAIAKRLEFYFECYDKFGFGVTAMIWKETGEMIGWSGLMPLEDTGEIEVGYGMSKEFWGKGIGLETARAWLDYGFNKAGLTRIVAVAQPENTGSWRIMEKCGMRYEKTETHYGIECLFYAITPEEFYQTVSK